MMALLATHSTKAVVEISLECNGVSSTLKRYYSSGCVRLVAQFG